MGSGNHYSCTWPVISNLLNITVMEYLRKYVLEFHLRTSSRKCVLPIHENIVTFVQFSEGNDIILCKYQWCHIVPQWVSSYFSSTADIVSGACPMLSPPSSDLSSSSIVIFRRSSFFFKSKRLLQFFSDLSDMWLECGQQYCENSVDFNYLSFASNF